jgi:uncharacterized protein
MPSPEIATQPRELPNEALPPTAQQERITSLDVVRGFALLGILLMNIVGFGLYHSAYNNPTAAGGSDGANLWIWAFLSVIAEGKMRCLFSIVFGASMVLLTSRMEGRADAADLYYRRLLWLLAIGIAHAYLLWQGEILYVYAFCGLILYPFRKMGPVGLTRIAALCIFVTSAFALVSGSYKQKEMEEAKAAIAKAERNETLTDEEKEAKEGWEKAAKERNPSPEALEKDAEKWRDGLLGPIKARAALLMVWHWIPYYHAWNFDIWGMMFLGMALFKWGVLGAARPASFYLGLAGIAYLIGIPVGIGRTWLYLKSGFDPIVEIYTFSLYDVQRLAMALGHAALLLWFCKCGVLRGLTDRLGAVGQMAFTNYVMHSVICAFLFTGYGLGLYGKLERHQLYYVVAAIWIFQLIVSPVWLRHFRFGPLEWGWRRLTYWQKIPIRRSAV